MSSCSSRTADSTGAWWLRATARYGELGISLDTTNNRLVGVAGGLRAVQDAMKREQLKELKDEYAELRKNLGALREEAATLEEHALTRLFGGKIKAAFGLTRDPKEISKDLREVFKRMKEVRDLMNRLEGKAVPNLPVAEPKGPKPITEAEWLAKQPKHLLEEPEERGFNLDRDWHQRQQEFARELDWRLHELRVSHIEDEEQRALESIRLRYAQEIDEAKRAHATVDNLARLGHERDMALAMERDRFRQQRAEEEAERERDLADEIRRAEIALIEDPDQRERARLAMEREQRLQEAHKEGATLEEIEAIKHLFRLREQAIGAQAGAADMARTQGTFSAFAAARMGQSPWHARLLKGVEEGAKAARRIEERQRLNQGIPVI